MLAASIEVRVIFDRKRTRNTNNRHDLAAEHVQHNIEWIVRTITQTMESHDSAVHAR